MTVKFATRGKLENLNEPERQRQQETNTGLKVFLTKLTVGEKLTLEFALLVFVYNFRSILEIRTEFSVWVQRGRPKDYLLTLYFFHNRRKSSKRVHDRVSYNYLTCNVRASQDSKTAEVLP